MACRIGAATGRSWRRAYLAHTIVATEFAEQKARELFGRDDVPQTLLVHTIAINAITWTRCSARLVARRYRFP